jgi:DNA-directed RNA polymerase subunit K/omega
MAVDKEEKLRIVKANEPTYFVVNLVSKRARQIIVNNAAPQVNLPSYTNPTDVATEELKQNKLHVRPRKFKYKVIDLIH